MGIPPKWFLRDDPIKMNDLGVPLFQETTIFLDLMVEDIMFPMIWVDDIRTPHPPRTWREPLTFL